MARPLRIDFPGARHHVMNRGARREPLFAGEEARVLFLGVLSELPERFGLHVHGYALMPNHYHLMVETPRGNLSRALRHLGAKFTQELNARHAWDGPVFKGRFRNHLVEDDAYWRHLLAYIHYNPVRAGLAPHVDATDTSSHAAYAGLGSTPEWLTTEDLLALHEGREGYRKYLWAYAAGRTVDPPGFDPEALWRPTISREVATPRPPPPPPMTLDEALAAFERVTGATRAQLKEGRPGRRGNPARQLAGWWLGRAADLPHREIARELDASVSQVSRWLHVLGEDRSEQMDRWVHALEDLLHPPPPGWPRGKGSTGKS